MTRAGAIRDGDRLLEMLADRALEGLSHDESRELDTLLAHRPGFDADCLDRAAGALAVALVSPDERPMPASLRQQLDVAAGVWVSSARRSGSAPALPRGDIEGRPSAVRIEPSGGSTRGRGALGPLGVLGWFAAAACLTLAAVTWVSNAPSLLPTQASLRDARASLIASAPGDLVRVAWTGTEDPAAAGGVDGELVWSDALDRGYMTFKGLAPNDASQSQYQLWIFDASRSADHPVDGGVFDIPSEGGEVVVPIDSRLPIERATLFAVTVERPGGVVVSSRERLAVLAKVGG